MLSDVVTAGSKALGGARFTLVNVLPGVLLASTVLVTARSGAYGPGPASFGDIIPDTDDPTVGGAVVLLFALFVAGVLIQPFQVALVQYLEGYWGDSALGRSAGAVATELHRRRLRTAFVEQDVFPPPPSTTTLAQVAAYSRAAARAERGRVRAAAILHRYPAKFDRLMPTMLGNVLRNAEDAAGDRYKLDAMTLYPRMYSSISKPLADAMSRQLDVITLTASMCVSFALGTLATTPVLLRLDLWSLVPLVTVLLAVLSYRGGVRAATSHGVLFATTFDLHRFDALRAMHYRLPDTFDEEQRLNGALTAFLQNKVTPDRTGLNHPYDHSIYQQPAALPPPTPEDRPRNEDVSAFGDGPGADKPSDTTPESGASGEPPLLPGPAR